MVGVAVLFSVVVVVVAAAASASAALASGTRVAFTCAVLATLAAWLLTFCHGFVVPFYLPPT